jgi:hypothetical protein
LKPEEPQKELTNNVNNKNINNKNNKNIDIDF